MPTLLIPAEALDRAQVEVKGTAYRHLFRARRLAVGEEVRLVDGCGRAMRSEVMAVNRHSGLLRIVGPAPTNQPPRRLELAVAALASDRASWLVEKCTEMGVSSIRFFNCARAPRSYGRATLDRLKRVAVAALEQSHRSRIPALQGMLSWQEIQDWIRDGEGPSAFLHPQAPEEWPAASDSSSYLLIGPEGGWTEVECQELEDLGSQAVGLGCGVLRVETAAVVGSALVLYGGDSLAPKHP